MTKIKIEVAKKIAIETIGKLDDKSRKDFLLIHSEKVGLVANLLAASVNMQNDLFMVAGWLHDIGNIIDNENHAENSLTILKERGVDVDEVLKDCILNHGDKKEAKTLEGKIFQIADKLSIFDIDTMEVFIKFGGLPMNKDYISFLRKLTKTALVSLEKFKK